MMFKCLYHGAVEKNAEILHQGVRLRDGSGNNSDAGLAEHAKAGDWEAWAILFLRYQSRNLCQGAHHMYVFEETSDNRSDAELVMRAKAGDQEAFAILFLRYKGRVYNCLMKVVDNNEVARDLFQDAYLKAWGNIQSLREPLRFRAWLLIVAKKLAFDYIRKNPPKRASQLEKNQEISYDPTNVETETDNILYVLKNKK